MRVCVRASRVTDENDTKSNANRIEPAPQFSASAHTKRLSPTPPNANPETMLAL